MAARWYSNYGRFTRQTIKLEGEISRRLDPIIREKLLAGIPAYVLRDILHQSTAYLVAMNNLRIQSRISPPKKRK